MKKLKMPICTMITICLMFNTCNTYGRTIQYWDDYLGFDGKPNHTWYEAADGSVLSNTKTSWSVSLKQIGWGGIWGAQMTNCGILRIDAGKKYQLHCVLQSSDCNKWVFIQVGRGNSEAYGKWVWLKKEKLTTINENFIALRNADSITFGFGGEYGDRKRTDGYVHYSWIPGGAEAIAAKKDADGDSGPHGGIVTVISCSDFYLGPIIKKTSLNKIERIGNQAKITLKKVKNVQGYQIQYSTTKKFKAKKTRTITTKKTTYTINKLKTSKKYYIKARPYKKVSKSKVYGEWSKIKTISKN